MKELDLGDIVPPSEPKPPQHKIAEIDSLRERLEEHGKIKDLLNRILLYVGLLTSIFKRFNTPLIVFGSAAVSYYVGGGYEPNDIDLLCNRDYRKFEKILNELGFRPETSLDHWYHKSLGEISLHFNERDEVEEDERTTQLNFNGYSVLIIRVEEAIIDRLCKYVDSNAENEIGPNLVYDMIRSQWEKIDFDYLFERAIRNGGKEVFWILKAIKDIANLQSQSNSSQTI